MGLLYSTPRRLGVGDSLTRRGPAFAVTETAPVYRRAFKPINERE